MTMPMSTQVLSCETWEIFEITYFEKHLWTTASVGVAILSNGNTTYGTKHLQNKNDQLQCFFERALLLYTPPPPPPKSSTFLRAKPWN